MSALPAPLLIAARTLRRGLALAVLMELQESLSDAEYRKIPVPLVVTRLGVHRSRVYRSVQRLEARGFLSRGPRLGNAVTYRLAHPERRVA